MPQLVISTQTVSSQTDKIDLSVHKYQPGIILDGQVIVRGEKMEIDISESGWVCPNIGIPDMNHPNCMRCQDGADPNYKLCLTQRITASLFPNTPFEPVDPEITSGH